MNGEHHDCVVIGSGPNGLSAAIVLQACGFKTHIIEKASTLGGGLKSDEAMGAGFIRDVCSAIHPMAVLSPLFRLIFQKQSAFEWIFPDVPCAHPLGKRDCVSLFQSVAETTDQFTLAGARRYRRLLGNLLTDVDTLIDEVLRPLLHAPSHPLTLARFGLRALWPANLLGNYLADEKASALFAGMAAHSFLPHDKFLSGAAGLMLMLAGHARGWPIARGGSGQIAQQLMEILLRLGGSFETATEIKDLRALPNNATLFFDVAPRQLARIAKDFLPGAYIKTLERYRYGPAAYKMDFLLHEPIPWAAPNCHRAGTVHLGGTSAEIAKAEQLIWRGELAELPFTLVAQQSRFDPIRAAGHKEVVWSYAHVPHACEQDVSALIENHIENYAPGFKDCIVTKKVSTPMDLETTNPNLVGGDIVGGVADFAQSIARPAFGSNPYRTPNERIYLCSASTPPGAGVHGMCGFWAAEAFIRTKHKKLNPLARMQELFAD